MTAAADRAKAAEPLTALEWLRVTHAGTLSGRRIEEALSAARADAAADRDRAWRTAAVALAEQLTRPAPALKGDYRAGYERGQVEAAARLRGLDPTSSEEE